MNKYADSESPSVLLTVSMVEKPPTRLFYVFNNNRKIYFKMRTFTSNRWAVLCFLAPFHNAVLRMFFKSYTDNLNLTLLLIVKPLAVKYYNIQDP